MTITITIDAEDGNKARMLMRELLTGYPDARAEKGDPIAPWAAHMPLVLDEAGFKGDLDKTASENALTDVQQSVKDGTFGVQLAPAAAAPTRERGKPSPGHARRTKAEIAEDDAAAKAGPIQILGQTDVVSEESDLVEDTPEDQAQDAADEAAETAAEKTGLTLDDLRNASGAYARKYGVAAAAEDVRQVLGFPLIECPDDGLAAAIAKVNEAVALNPFERAVVGETKAEAAPPATEKKVVGKKDLIDLMLAYALKFDGQNTDTNPAAMPIATEDVVKCFQLRFGEGIKKLGDLKPEQYEQAYIDVKSMLDKNGFNRTPKVAA